MSIPPEVLEGRFPEGRFVKPVLIPELVPLGMARIVPSGDAGTYYRTTPEGDALLKRVAQHNARVAIEHPELERERFQESLRQARSAGGGKKK